MKSVCESKNNRSGFSVIELLVAVAVIGIIGTLTMPAYRNYSARARQAEAKVNLTAIYAAEKSVKAEYGYYTGCLAAIGFVPEGSRRYYTTGFSAAFNGFNLDPYRAFGPSCDTLPSGGNIQNETYFKATAYAAPVTGTALPTVANIPTDSGVDGSHFLVYAVGHVGFADQANKKDYWSIDMNKNLMASSSAGSTPMMNAGVTCSDWNTCPGINWSSQ